MALSRIWPAPAKLNLFLHVTGRRPMAITTCRRCFSSSTCATTSASPCATTAASSAPPARQTCRPKTDLVVRAARALKAATGTPLGASLRVTKRIPMGGGLGGGSSDAATTLLALNHLWALA